MTITEPTLKELVDTCSREALARAYLCRLVYEEDIAECPEIGHQCRVDKPCWNVTPQDWQEVLDERN